MSTYQGRHAGTPDLLLRLGALAPESMESCIGVLAAMVEAAEVQSDYIPRHRAEVDW